MRLTMPPTRPWPMIMMSCCSLISSISRSWLLAKRGSITRSNRINSSGVIIIDRATTSISRSAIAAGMTELATVKERSTKPNSPACASDSAINQRSAPRTLKTQPKTNNMPALSATKPRVRASTFVALSNSRSRLMLAPMVIKNSPSNRPLNGAISDSSSWRYSLLASTTPAKKVPRAGERPTSVINRAMPITINRAVAVKSSGKRALAIKRNNGRVR